MPAAIRGLTVPISQRRVAAQKAAALVERQRRAQAARRRVVSGLRNSQVAMGAVKLTLGQVVLAVAARLDRAALVPMAVRQMALRQASGQAAEATAADQSASLPTIPRTRAATVARQSTQHLAVKVVLGVVIQVIQVRKVLAVAVDKLLGLVVRAVMELILTQPTVRAAVVAALALEQRRAVRAVFTVAVAVAVGLRAVLAGLGNKGSSSSRTRQAAGAAASFLQ